MGEQQAGGQQAGEQQSGQQPSFDELAKRVRAVQAQVSGRVIIGLVGEPGAGKSTVSQALCEQLTDAGVRAVVVPMDGFHLANVELARLGLADRKGAIDTFDVAGYVALLHRLRAQNDGEVVYAPIYAREIEESVGSALPVEPDVQVVITEGNYLLADRPVWRDIAGLLDECWYVATPHEVRLERLIARHMRFGKAPEVAAAWVEAVDEKNAELIRATRGRADLVVDAP